MSKERHFSRCGSAFLKIGSRSLKIEDSQASPAQTGRFFTKRLRQGDWQVDNGKTEGND
ncbi:MAG: hypothetical protein MJZ76_02120 [Bacteroidales bacterium]|nr:hypothetical protein [Bacteroidales bacterium]